MIEFSDLAEVIIDNWGIIGLFFLVAMIYSSVGFGGGSSYLAILALTGMSFIQFRAISLLCNIVVVSGGTYVYYKKGLFNYKKIIPLAIFSVPLSFLGGYLKIGQTLFFVVLGISLVVASVSMYYSKDILSLPKQENKKTAIKDSFLGGFIGFISGMIGVGGGVFLAPVLHFTNWDTPKRIAAATSFFILVNSIAGLFGQFQNNDFVFEPQITFVLMLVVFLGGQIGSRLSSSKLTPLTIKRITAILIAFVGLQILYKQFF